MGTLLKGFPFKQWKSVDFGQLEGQISQPFIRVELCASIARHTPMGTQTSPEKKNPKSNLGGEQAILLNPKIGDFGLFWAFFSRFLL